MTASAVIGRRLWLVVLFVSVSVLYLHGLANVGVLGPDEPRYAAIGREMARSGDWVTPRLWGIPWFEKPALLYWLIGGAYRLGFDDNWAPRIGVAGLSLLFLLFFYVQMRREFGDRAALYSSVVLGTSAGWFAFSQVGVTDLPMAAAFGASLLLALRWVRSGGRRGLLLAGMLLGVAVLGKGLVPLVLASPLVWVGRKRWRDLFVYVAGCVATALPWYWLCYARNGWPFIEEFFLEHQLGRFSSETLQHVQPFWFYVPILFAGLFPWFPLLHFVWRKRDGEDPRRVLLLLVAAFGLVFFSASTNKLPGYLLPLFPPIAALIGIHLAESEKAAWALAACMAVLAGVPVIAQILPAALSAGLSKVVWQRFHWFALVPAFAAAALCWWLATTGRRTRAVFVAAGSAMAAILVLQYFVYPALEREVSMRQVWRKARESGADQCVGALRRSEVYGVNFYVGKELPACPEKGHMRGIRPGRVIW